MSIAGKRLPRNRRIAGNTANGPAAMAPQRNDELYRQLAESSTDFIFVIDRDSRVMYVNRSGADALRMRPEDATGKHLNVLFPPDAVEIMVNGLSRVFETGKPLSGEMVHLFDQGKYYIHVLLTPFFDGYGKVDAVMGISRDINDLKKAEEALQESEERLRLCSATARFGTFDWDIVRDRHVWSPETYEIYGVPQGTPLTLDYLNSFIYPGDRQDEVLAAGLDPAGPGEYSMEYRIRRASDGEVRWVYVRTRVIFEGERAERRAVRLLGAIQDITERKKNEETLANAKEQVELYLDLMGHDINNMNQAGIGFLELACEAMERKGKIEKEDAFLIDKTLEALWSSTNLIKSVRKLQQISAGEFSSRIIDIGRVLTDLCEEYRRIPERDVTFNLSFGESTGPHFYVKANDLVRDLFINLINNAIKHSDPEKPLVITLGLRTVEQNGRRYQQATIEDNGPGIPDALKAKIFTRLQRGDTKASGRGLGLYIVKTLVEKYNGSIMVEDRRYGDYTKGVRFVVMLPAAEQ